MKANALDDTQSDAAVQHMESSGAALVAQDSRLLWQPPVLPEDGTPSNWAATLDEHRAAELRAGRTP